MSEISHHRYEDYDLRTKFGWINGAPGIAAVESARTGLLNISGAFESSDMGIRDVLGPLGAGWQGQAALAAGQSLTEAATWAGGASAAQAGGGGSVGGYGESFEALRPRVHWEDPGMYGLWDRTVDAFGSVFDVQSDHQAKVEANRALDAQANAALYAHEQTAREQLAAFPAVEPVAPIATDTSTAAFGGGPAVGSASGAAPGAAGSGAGAVTTAAAGVTGAGAASAIAGAGAGGAAGGITGAGAGGAAGPVGAGAGGAAGSAPPAAASGAAGALAPAVGAGAATASGGQRAGAGPAVGSGPGAAAGARPPGGAGLAPLAPRSTVQARAAGSSARPGLGLTSGVGVDSGAGVGTARPSTGAEFARRLGIATGAPGGGSPGWGTPVGLGRTGPALPPLTPGDPGARPGGPLEATGQRAAAATTTTAASTGGRPTGMHGFAPMAAGMGGAGGGDSEHTNRYRDPSSDAFEVDLPYTDPVIGGPS